MISEGSFQFSVSSWEASVFPAEDVGRGEVAKAAVTLPFSPVPKRNVALVPGLQLGYGGDRGPEPACLPSWGWLPSNFPAPLLWVQAEKQ